MTEPSITEWNNILALRADDGPCGTVLQTIPEWIVREAARREDTWDFLLGVKDLTTDAKQFCRAAKSAQYGAYRLARMARGIATPRTDWAEEYRTGLQATDKRLTQRNEDRLLASTEAIWPGQLELAAPDPLKQLVRDKVAALNEGIKRRLGRRKFDERAANRPSARLIASAACNKFPREWLLITGWLRIPNGDPGLCFLSKTALAQLFHELGFRLSPATDPKSDNRQRLRRLRLVQGPILIRGVFQRDDGAIVLTLRNWQGYVLKTSVDAAGLRYRGALAG
jgi:hypothetical protein